MADRIKGITIEIGGDTTGLNKALSGVNKEISSTQSALKDVERLLKLDPSNTELLRQKQKLLADAVGETKGKLDTLKEANKQVAESASNYEAWNEKYEPIKKQIEETKKKLTDLKEQSKDADKQLASGEISQEKYDAIQEEIKQTSSDLRVLQRSAKEVSDEFGNPVSPEQYDALQREIVDTEQKLKSLEDQAGKANVTLQQIAIAGEKFQEAGQKIEGVGKKLLPITGAVAGIGAAAVKTTADFDSSMSNVSAISGATGEDFDRLRDKAREMGAETKFSASEAADAMSYMAMAGWKTEDMLGGIGGIMSLAAASGADLATTSDIVTDALTGMGYTAADAGRLADVMAAASSNANTNVEMMGETFKYVAPVCGSLGYSMEDTALAVGLMANSGIKASQAGTQLRGALTNMVKPTEAMEGVMNELGIEIANEDGSMKSLDETLKILRSSFAVTTEEQKAQRLATLEQQAIADGYGDSLAGLTEEEKYFQLAMYAGQEQIKGMSEAQFKKQAQDKLGIKVTKKTNKAQVAQNLALALGTQAIEGLTQEQQSQYAATIFGKEAMSGMLAIINASEEDYNKLSDAIKNSEGAAEEMAGTMQENLNGQLQILKSQLEEAAISIGDTLIPMIRNLVGKIQEWMDWFNQLDDSQKQMIVTVGLIVAALGPLLIIIGQIATGIGSIMSLVATLGPLFAAGGPIMLGVTAIGLMGAAIYDTRQKADDYYHSLADLSEEEQENKRKVDELKSSYEKLAEKRKDSLGDIDTQAQHESDLWKELQNITDENGKIQEGQEARAEFIVGELQDALGIEIDIVGDQIQEYKDLGAQIDTVIEKKRQEATLAAFEEEYRQALKDKAGAQEAYTQALSDSKAASDEYKIAVADMEKKQNALNEALRNFSEDGNVTERDLEDLRIAYQAAADTAAPLKDHLDQVNQTLADSESAWTGINTTIQNYEGAASAIISGDQAAISSALTLLTNDFQTAETSTRESLQAQCDTYRSKLKEAREAVKEGSAGITDEYVSELVRLELKARQELAKIPEAAGDSVEDVASTVRGKSGEMEAVGGAIAAGLALGVASGQGEVIAAATAIAADAVDAVKDDLEIHSPSRVTHDIGLNYAAGFVGGITEGSAQVAAAVSQVATAATSTLETQLQQSRGTTQTYQSAISSGWSTWAAGLTTTVNTALSGISANTSTQLSGIRSSYTNETTAIALNWSQKWKEIETKHKETMDKIRTLTETVLQAIKSLNKTETSEIKTDTITAMAELVDGTRTELEKLEPTMKSGYEPAIKYIKDLIPQARTWANDMMDGYIEGIREKIRELEEACEDVAGTVSDYMHFTRPEKGPLRDYEEWMPHMMQGFAKGVRDNRSLITDQMRSLTEDMAALQMSGQQVRQSVNLTSYSVVALDGKQVAEAVNEQLGILL